MVARLWGGITPAALRDCTRAEYDAMVAQLGQEVDQRRKGR